MDLSVIDTGFADGANRLKAHDKVNAPIEDAINDYFADSVLPSVDSCSS